MLQTCSEVMTRGEKKKKKKSHFMESQFNLVQNRINIIIIIIIIPLTNLYELGALSYYVFRTTQ